MNAAPFALQVTVASNPADADSSGGAPSIEEGAIASMEAIFQTSAPDSVKRVMFDSACWLVSERNGKFTTRYRSEASLTAPKSEWRHEHVIPRAQLWSSVVNETMTVAEALEACDACVVTKSEHYTLHKFKEAHGWERYARAGIPVVDCLEQKLAAWEDLIQAGRKCSAAVEAAPEVSVTP